MTTDDRLRLCGTILRAVPNGISLTKVWCVNRG